MQQGFTQNHALDSTGRTSGHYSRAINASSTRHTGAQSVLLASPFLLWASGTGWQACWVASFVGRKLKIVIVDFLTKSSYGPRGASRAFSDTRCLVVGLLNEFIVKDCRVVVHRPSLRLGHIQRSGCTADFFKLRCLHPSSVILFSFPSVR